MKKVVIVNNTLGEGGAEKVLIDILNRFDYTKYKVTLLLLNNKGVHFNKLNKNVKLKYIYPNINSNNNLINRLWNFFKYRTMKHLYKYIYNIYVGIDNDIEIAFLEGEPTNFVSRSINTKSKKIAWVHTDLEKCRPKDINESDRYVYSKFDEIVCVSNYSKKSFCELYSELECKVNVIYNLIEVNKINKLANDKIDFNFNKPTIISVGRLTRIKRFDLIIKAHKNILEKGIDHNLIILGIGEQYIELVNLTKNLGVEDSTKFLGFIDNPYPYIKGSDVFVTASEFEGFSLVIAESMVLGKAIISTQHGGARELLDNGLFGKLVEINNLDILQKEIENILKNKEERNLYEEKAICRSVIFSPDAIMSEIYRIMEY